MVAWYFRAYRCGQPLDHRRSKDDHMIGQAITWNMNWTHAPRFVALALVAFIAGVTFGVAGF